MSEQQLLQCGPESFFRALVKPTVPAKRRRGRSQAMSAAGAPAPERTVNLGDHHELVTTAPDNAHDVFPVDQLVIHDEKEQEHFIRLFPGMRPEQLKERVEKAGIKKIPKAWAHFDDGRSDEYKRLFEAVWPKANLEDLAPTEPGERQLPGRIKLTVTDHYFRALAKIGFHHYLAHSRRGFRGDEDCFASIRAFIMNGGHKDHFFQQSGRTFAMPFGHLASGGGLTPSQWCHVLAADESGNQVVVYVQMFVGPGCVPSPYYITLARIDSSLVIPSFVWAHVYLYDDPQQSGRYAGGVVDAQIARLHRR